MLDYKRQLEVVRQYTGDAFSASHGYDLRKPANFGKRMAVLKYYRKIAELKAVETQIYTPKPKEKREAFNYTGQSGFKKFTKAIVRKQTSEQDFTFDLDKSKPRGHRFVAIDKNTGRRYYNIPAHLLFGTDDDEVDASFYADVIAEYAPDAQYFLIQAGELYMWGAGGGRRQIADKLVAIRRNYSELQFDANDKNSHYYGNWFRGVTGFTSRLDILDKQREALRRQADYRKATGAGRQKFRRMLGYDEQGVALIGTYELGELISVDPKKLDRELTPHQQGYAAYLQGTPKRPARLAHNPYSPSIPAFNQWRRGWLTARKDAPGHDR